MILLLLQVAVSGTFQYQDRDYTAAGFTGTLTPRPIRQAEVEILRDSDQAVLGSGVTDEAGLVAIGGIPLGESVRARIYARRSGGRINAVVLDTLASSAVYAGTTSPAIDTGTTLTFGVVLFTIAGGAAPAFNLFDCAVKSFQYQAGVDADLPSVPPLLRIFWAAGSANGTYYSSALDGIFLLGLASDPDEYDDDIVLHEIGHWVADVFSRDDTLGGPHSVVDQLDARTAWSEGWAHFWSSAVRRSFPAWYPAPSTQVDNFGSGFSVFDLEFPSFPAQAIMATNELAVAAALWDITDVTNEAGFDFLSGNETEVWQILDARMPLLANLTLEDFRAGLELEAPALLPWVTGSETELRILNAREILYYPDGSEPNGPLDPAPALLPGPGSLLRRTIFGSGDEDWYSVDVSARALLDAATSNLGDGGNTILELFAADRTTLMSSNDDRSPGVLSSRIRTVVQGPGTYYLRVRRSGNVVEHGYYDLLAQAFAAPPADASEAGYCSGGSVTGSPFPLPAVISALLLLGLATCSLRR